ncbi:hypothetical protein F4809DRAFT_652406 [Biscogniauxia mediterranea]|nr:hypothetical protein F4809DRAFT_652406 [Biscogniauxia mediterranea]
MYLSISGIHISIVVIGFILTPLAIAALRVRLWSGWIQQASLAFNDYMAIVAMVFATSTAIICLVGFITYLDAFVGSIGIHASELLAAKPWEVSLSLKHLRFCTPVEHNWDRSIPGGKCDNEQAAYLIAGIMNLVIDAFIVALPMPMLFGPQMSLTKRLSIVGMFSLGGL